MADVNRREFLASQPVLDFPLAVAAGPSLRAACPAAVTTAPWAQRRAPPREDFRPSGRGTHSGPTGGGPAAARKQHVTPRDFHEGVPDDDVLHGHRASAGLAAADRLPWKRW